MKKQDELEKLIESDEHFVGCYSTVLLIKEEIRNLAIAYAKLCLEKAAEEAYIDDDGKDYQPHYWIVKESITNIELP